MNLDKICRMCSSQKSRVKSIFTSYKRERLLSIITDVVRIDISEGDGFPANICKPCASTLIRIQQNLEEFRANETALRRKLSGQKTERDEAAVGEPEVVKEEPKDLKGDPSVVEENLQDFIIRELSLSDDHKPYSESDEPPAQNGHHEETLALKPVNAEFAEANDISAPNPPLYGIESDDEVSSTSDSGSDFDPEELQTPKRRAETIRASRKPRIVKASESPIRKEKRKRRRKSVTEEDEDRPKVNDHKCYICRSDSMGSAKALLEHLTTHLDRTPFTCTECKMETVVLKSVRSLNVHLKMHAQPMKCEYCDRRYCDDRARDYHVKTYHLGESAPCPSTCDQCGKVCKSISALKSHMRDHRLSLKCEHCDKIFHRRNKLKEHVTRVHEKAEKYECNLCHRVVHSLESYNSHLKMHMSEKTYECDLCPMKFYTAGNLGLHKKIHSGNANYKPHKDWSGHYTVTQEPGQDKIYTCKLCGKSYTKTVMKINNHLKNHFKDIKCDRCDLKFVNESQLKTHYVVHTGIRQFKCEFCGKDFLHKNNLTQHLKLHRNEQNYACEFCGKLFTYKEGMKAHIRNHHLRESPYECAPCRRKFVDNASLARHIAAEHEPPLQQVDLGPPPLMGTASVPQQVPLQGFETVGMESTG